MLKNAILEDVRNYSEYKENIIFEEGFELGLEQISYTMIFKIDENDFTLYTAIKRPDGSIDVNKVYITSNMLEAMINSKNSSI